MKVRDWLEATSTRHGLKLSPKEKAARLAERERVLAKAGTSIVTLRICKCKDRIGDGLLYRMAEATKGEKHRIHVRDERPEP